MTETKYKWAHRYLRLTRDVKNPSPDRRCKDNFDTAALWKAGTALRLRAETVTKDVEGTEVTHTHSTLSCGRGGLRWGSVPEHEAARFEALMAAVEEREPDARDICWEVGIDAVYLLERLHKGGAVTTATLRAYAALMDRED